MFKVYNNVHREIIINHFSKKSIIYPIRDINNFNINFIKIKYMFTLPYNYWSLFIEFTM